MRIGYSDRGGWFWSMGCLGWTVLAVIVLGVLGYLLKEVSHL